MPSASVPILKPCPGRRIRLIRWLRAGLFAVVFGWLLRQVEHRLTSGPQPAGFYCGLVQGALMPTALPSLLTGSDVAIYAQSNTGLIYKLGYTLGVNLCGLLFFGFFFLRLQRWRSQSLAHAQPTTGPPPHLAPISNGSHP